VSCQRKQPFVGQIVATPLEERDRIILQTKGTAPCGCIVAETLPVLALEFVDGEWQSRTRARPAYQPCNHQNPKVRP
jgi:hypothetical protein